MTPDITIVEAKEGETYATATAPAVIVYIDTVAHGFTAGEALIVAEILEEAAKKFADSPAV
jgi:predicted RecB family endonuclease